MVYLGRCYRTPSASLCSAVTGGNACGAPSRGSQGAVRIRRGRVVAGRLYRTPSASVRLTVTEGNACGFTVSPAGALASPGWGRWHDEAVTERVVADSPEYGVFGPVLLHSLSLALLGSDRRECLWCSLKREPRGGSGFAVRFCGLSGLFCFAAFPVRSPRV